MVIVVTTQEKNEQTNKKGFDKPLSKYRNTHYLRYQQFRYDT